LLVVNNITISWNSLNCYSCWHDQVHDLQGIGQQGARQSINQCHTYKQRRNSLTVTTMVQRRWVVLVIHWMLTKCPISRRQNWYRDVECLTVIDGLFQSVGTATRKARAAVAVFVFGTLSRARSKERKVRTRTLSLMYSWWHRRSGLSSNTLRWFQQIVSPDILTVHCRTFWPVALCLRTEPCGTPVLLLTADKWQSQMETSYLFSMIRFSLWPDPRVKIDQWLSSVDVSGSTCKMRH